MIDFQFHRDGTGHKDIVFCLHDYSCVCDSYYFFIDYNFYPDDGSVDKALKVMRQLLQQWMIAIENLTENETVYLPFDFSDQYTGCVECTVSQGKLVLRAGYSNREAWRSWPSDISNYIHAINDFKVYANFTKHPVKMMKATFLSDISKSQDKLFNPLDFQLKD